MLTTCWRLFFLVSVIFVWRSFYGMRIEKTSTVEAAKSYGSQ